MSKLKLIIHREFFAKVKNKSFIIMTFLSPVLVIAMIALIVFLMKKNDEKVKKIGFVGVSDVIKIDDFKETEYVKYEDYTAIGLKKAKEKIKEEGYYGIIYVPQKNNIDILSKSVQFYSEDTPSMDMIKTIEENIEKKLHKLKLKSLNLDIQKIEQSEIHPELKLFNFSGEKSSKMGSLLKTSLGMLAGYLLMMFVMIYGASVMRSVIEEKTSRIVEIIVSSIKPFQLMMGKIIGNALAGLLQFATWGLLIFIFSYIATSYLGIDLKQDVDPEQLKTLQNTGISTELVLMVKDFFSLPLYSMFFLFVFYFLGGYLLYSSLYAAIGAAVDNEADSQQFMTPIMMPLVLAVYVGFTAVTKDPHGPVSVIFSHIPLTSPIVMIMRYPFGVAWWEILISSSLLLITFIAIVWFAAKIYRVGILSYGKKASYKDLWKWLRYKG